MRNMEELRDELSSVFAELKSGKMEVKVGAELVNAAGKIINTVKCELEYYALSKEKPQIPFINPEDRGSR